MIAVYKTHLGMKRKNNQDSLYVSQEHADVFFALVADGMGGHNAGEIASAIAAKKIPEFIIENYRENMSLEEVKDIMVRSINVANWEIYNESLKSEQLQGMGTTASVVLFHDNSFIIVHVGDSRIYGINLSCPEDAPVKETITQITKDHSFVSALVEKGYITKEEAMVHPQKNVITRAVGISPSVNADTFIYGSDNTCILICSDGLTNYIDDDEIYDIITKDNELIKEDFEEKAATLVDKANERGGADNITVILLKS